MEIDYKTKINRITFLTGQVVLMGVLLVLSSKITCPFKIIFQIPCPFCGMTRAIDSLLKLHIKESINYNILLIPLLISILIIDIIYIIEIIKNKKLIKKRINSKILILIITISLIISTCWGIIHNV